MRIKLVEAAGKPYSRIQSKIEDQLEDLYDIGLSVNLSRAVIKNKYQTYYFGTLRRKPITIIVSTTNVGIDDENKDVFITIEYNGEVTKLGAASSKNKSSIRNLFNYYFKSIDDEKEIEINKKKELEKIKQQEKLARDEESRQRQEEYNKQLQLDYEESRKKLSMEYSELTGRDIPEEMSNEEAEDSIKVIKFKNDFKDFSEIFSKKGKHLYASFNKQEDSKLIKVQKLAYNKYYLDNKVVTLDEVNSQVESLLKDGYLPNMMSVYGNDDMAIESAVYR